MISCLLCKYRQYFLEFSFLIWVQLVNDLALREVVADSSINMLWKELIYFHDKWNLLMVNLRHIYFVNCLSISFIVKYSLIKYGFKFAKFIYFCSKSALRAFNELVLRCYVCEEFVIRFIIIATGFQGFVINFFYF